jgi:repressor LexA
MEYKLTERQKEIYLYLMEYNEKYGVAPTYDEIKEFFSFSSKNAVAKHIGALVKRGVLKKHNLMHRGLKLNAKPEEITIQIRGIVKAGSPVECFENFETISVFPRLLKNPEKTFALEVSGDSMIDAGIGNGDLIFLEDKNYAESGDIVLASVDGGQTLKRFFIEGRNIRLQPENKELAPIVVTPEQDFCIQGVLVGIWKTV